MGRRLMRSALLALLAGSPLAAQEAPVGADGLGIDPALVIDGGSAVDAGAGELALDPALAEGDEAWADLGGIAAELDRQDAAARAQVPAGTLADMQADLRAVAADLQALRAELIASGADGFAAAGGDTAIDRMNAIEDRLSALTERTEQLENRVRRVVADGTNRVGDIEFRLCELDPACDLGALMTAELGQAQGAAAGVSAGGVATGGPDITATPLPPLDGGTEPAPGSARPPTEGESRAFAGAQAALDEGRWDEAIAAIDALLRQHEGAPMAAEALFLRGVAHQAAGRVPAAAESWLRAFSADPTGPRAAASLTAMARALAALGEPADACQAYSEVSTRFPGTAEAAEAEQALEAAACSPVPAGDDAAAEGRAVPPAPLLDGVPSEPPGDDPALGD